MAARGHDEHDSHFLVFRYLSDRSLIMKIGGIQNRGGGKQVKIYPYKKVGGGGKSFGHAEEGVTKTKGFDIVLT